VRPLEAWPLDGRLDDHGDGRGSRYVDPGRAVLAAHVQVDAVSADL
jgi:hypothetical protein